MEGAIEQVSLVPRPLPTRREGPGDEATGRYTAAMTVISGLLGSVPMVFTFYGFSGLIYCSQPLRFTPNRLCMSLVIIVNHKIFCRGACSQTPLDTMEVDHMSCPPYFPHPQIK